MIKRNAKYLFFGNAANVLFPLFITPLLAYKLGIDQFANFAIVIGVVQYIAYFLELGFNNIAIKIFSEAEIGEKKQIFTSIFLAKLLLLIFISLPLCLYVLDHLLTSWEWRGGLSPLFVIPLVTCLTYPAWFFTANNTYKVNFIAQILNKIFILIFVILLVQDHNDAQVAAFVFSISAFIVTIPFARLWLPYFDLKKSYDFNHFYNILINGIKAGGISARDAWSANGIAPIIGLLVPNLQMGEFVLVEKVIRALSMPASGFAAILLANRKKLDYFLQSTKKIGLYAILGFVFYVLLVVLAFVVLNNKFTQHHKLIIIFLGMSGVVPFVYLNYIIINHLFIAHSRYGYLTLAIGVQSAITVISVVQFLLSSQWLAAALTVTASEIFLFFALVVSAFFHSLKE